MANPERVYYDRYQLMKMLKGLLEQERYEAALMLIDSEIEMVEKAREMHALMLRRPA